MEKHVWINNNMETRVWNFTSAQQQHDGPTTKQYDAVKVLSS